MFQRNILPLLFLICTFFVVSCELKEDSDIEVPEKWEKVRGFEEGLFDAREIDGKLYTASWTRIYPDASIQGPNNFVDLSPFLRAMFPYKLPITDKLIAVVNPTQLTILPSDDPKPENALVMNMKDIDPDFLEFHFSINAGDDKIAILSDGSIIVPYRSRFDDRINNTPDFLLVKTAVDGGRVVLLETKLIKDEYFDRSVTIYNMKAFGSFTRVAIGDKTFDIDPAGNMELRFEEISKSVEVDGEIFAFAMTSPYENPQIHVYKSDLTGKNNQLIATYDSSNISLSDNLVLSQITGNLYSVNGVILVQSAWWIYKLSMDGQQLVLTRLENNGLENSDITSITLLGDSKVFVTAVCHNNEVFYNCGGFIKSLDNFFNPLESNPR
ncbi:hypothetical protein [Mariniradius sediminis]|uniref:TolB-like 6-blade propeller-like n=1 Tax=Mariniradius sediminis TaxID=2909237 RepID=A0ABS9BQE3_9BACT|nr:hypothetical protein [Mariniradius sediminis]MCF1749685.1 hypothetical protein [Mariniradius sediminis]